MINTFLIFLSLLTFEVDHTNELISYFIRNKTELGLILDRESNRNITSISGTGFGYCAWVEAVKRNLIKRDDAILWIKTSVNEVARINRNNGGWLYHFSYLNGKPAFNEEISSIDTCLYLLCLRKAAKELNDDELKRLSFTMISNVNVSLLLDKQNLFYHGFFAKDGNLSTVKLIPYVWDENSEGIILYKLFNIEYKPKKERFDLPLFVYYFPLCFYDDKFLYDSLVKALSYQVKNNQGLWGYTMCDNEHGGYSFEPGLISPIAIYSCSRYFPRESKIMLNKLKSSPLICSMTVDGKWKNLDKVAIDYGVALILTQK